MSPRPTLLTIMIPTVPFALLVSGFGSGALAASLTFALDGEYASGSTVDLPPEGNSTHPNSDAGRANLPYNVTLRARDFVCTSECVFHVSVNVDQGGFPLWAGASINPATTRIRIPASQPGAQERTYQSTDPVVLEIAWNLEARPNNEDSQKYVLTMDARLEAGSPSPPPQDGDYHYVPYDITFRMANRAPRPPCEMDPAVNTCPSASDPGSNPEQTPGIGLPVALLAAAGLVWGSRARKP